MTGSELKSQPQLCSNRPTDGLVTVLQPLRNLDAVSRPVLLGVDGEAELLLEDFCADSMLGVSARPADSRGKGSKEPEISPNRNPQGADQMTRLTAPQREGGTQAFGIQDR